MSMRKSIATNFTNYTKRIVARFFVMRRRILFLGAGIAILLGGYLWFGTSPAGFPTFQEVRAAHQQSEAFLLDRHHEVIHKLRIDKTGRRLDWVALKDVSPALQSATVFAEDRRFYAH